MGVEDGGEGRSGGGAGLKARGWVWAGFVQHSEAGNSFTAGLPE
jgi:hypothetical protein